MVGYKLAKPSLFISIFKKGWVEFIPFIATIIGILMTDLLIGIGIGLFFSLLFILYVNYKASHYLIRSEEDGKEIFTVHFMESMTFLNKASLREELDSIPTDSSVVLDYDRVIHQSNDIKEIIEEFEIRAKNENIQIETKGQGNISKKVYSSAR